MNSLDHLEEFRELLRDYHVSAASAEVLSQTNLALLVAPSSGGRNTIIRELVKTGHFHYIVSDTTRKPRTNDGVPEQNGVEYWFRTEDEVLSDLKAGKFLEAAIIHNQQVSGISIRELEAAKGEGKIAVTDIEIVGVQNIIAAKPDAHALFVLPPSFEEWIKRMEARGEMHPEEKQRRLQSALQEFMAALTHDYYAFVVNDTVAHAAEQIQALTSGQVDEAFQAEARTLAAELLTNTRAHLEK